MKVLSMFKNFSPPFLVQGYNYFIRVLGANHKFLLFWFWILRLSLLGKRYRVRKAEEKAIEAYEKANQACAAT